MQKLLAALLLTLPWCWLFVRPIVNGESYAYRDVAHYYYPLWQLVSESWSGVHGRDGFWDPPLWNPFENGGQPLAADATACAFYPITFVITRLLPYPFALKSIIALHAAGACLAMLFAARRMGRSGQASLLAGLSYAFGGYVVAQHANVIYLTGAMWLPLALYSGQRVIEQGRWQHALGLAIALALMVLGGDPQTAYHVAIVLFGFLGLRIYRDQRADRSDPSHDTPAAGSKWQCIGLLVMGLVLASALAGIQIIPSMQLGRQSIRAVYNTPRSIWEKLNDRGTADVDDAAAKDDRHDGKIDSFSFPAWRLTELVWPNVSGRAYPIYSRWTQHAFHEGRIWIPSIYVGALPLLLAVVACRDWKNVRRRWFLFVGLVSLISACGYAGGLYWVEVLLLPGYSLFRYPSKWLLLFSWAVSLLAAEGWDDLRTGRRFLVGRITLISIITTVMVLLILQFVRGQWEQFVSRAPADDVFGPLDVPRAWRDMNASLLQHVIVAAAIFFCTRRQAFAKNRIRALLLLLTGFDLLLAHQWQVVTVRDALFNRPAQARTLIERAEENQSARVSLMRLVKRPPQWSQQSSANRCDQIVSWDRDTLFPKYHLNQLSPAIVNLHSPTALMTVDRAALLDVFHSQRDLAQTSNEIFGSYYSILSDDRGENLVQVANGAYLEPPVERTLRAWVAYNYVIGPPPPSSKRRIDWRNWCERSLRASADHESLPVLHAPPGAARPPAASERLWSVIEDCTDVTSSCVRIRVRLSQPGLMVLRDSYAPGWQATVHSDRRSWDAKIWRVNVIQRGLLLPAGEHEVVLRYRPKSFRFAAAVSLLSWVGCIIFSISYWGAKLLRPARPTSRDARKT